MKKLSVFFGIICLSLLACNGSSNSGYSGGSYDKTTSREMAPSEAPAAAPEPGSETSAAIPAIERKIIRTGNVTFETSNLGKTKAFLNQLASGLQCYIASDNQYKSGDRIEEEMVLRIPAQNFDTLLLLLEKEAHYFEQKNISSQDVTEEYVDVEIRIKNKKALEIRYNDLLKSTRNVKEIMEVERQINEVREQIEQAEGRLKYLGNQTSFSTLTIHFYERTAAPRGWLSKFGQAFTKGWDSFVYFLVGVVYLWPFWLFIAAIIWGIRRYWRRRHSIKKS